MFCPGKEVIAIVGPTGCGKSSLAIGLAELLGGEIVNADAFQVYRGMAVGTNQTPEKDRRGVPHHLFGFVDPGSPWDVCMHQRAARRAIAGAISRGKIPIVCGGSGMYVSAIVKDYTFLPEGPKRSYDGVSNEVLRAEVERRDPQTAAKIPVQNRRRLISALSFLENHSVLKSENDSAAARFFYDVKVLFLDPPLAALSDALRLRVSRMAEAGLSEEASALVRRNPGFLSTQAGKAIGYAEILAQPPDLAQMAQRNIDYVKTQRTWFKSMAKGKTLVLDDFGKNLSLHSVVAALEGLQNAAAQ